MNWRKVYKLIPLQEDIRQLVQIMDYYICPKVGNIHSPQDTYSLRSFDEHTKGVVEKILQKLRDTGDQTKAAESR